MPSLPLSAQELLVENFKKPHRMAMIFAMPLVITNFAMPLRMIKPLLKAMLKHMLWAMPLQMVMQHSMLTSKLGHGSHIVFPMPLLMMKTKLLHIMVMMMMMNFVGQTMQKEVPFEKFEKMRL
jgi:hypothetical protein